MCSDDDGPMVMVVAEKTKEEFETSFGGEGGLKLAKLLTVRGQLANALNAMCRIGNDNSDHHLSSQLDDLLLKVYRAGQQRGSLRK
ncbi:MAG: hypothetical protein WC646_02890 [Candidatus Paceibacterota bacterium]